LPETNETAYLAAIDQLEKERDGKTPYLETAEVSELSLVQYAAELDAKARAGFFLTYVNNIPFIRHGVAQIKSFPYAQIWR